MQGYIYLETPSEQSACVRILTRKENPLEQDAARDGMQLRYVARFKNAHVAYMHVHNTLKRSLENLNTRIYAVSLAQAIAAVECEDLDYERIWIDPALDAGTLQAIAEQVTVLQQSRRRVDKAYWLVGGIAVLLLCFILLGGVWNA